jgi:hypothetical protein
MKTEMMKRRIHSLVFGFFLAFLSGCGPSFQTGGRRPGETGDV